jgi:ABC-type transporter Mla subunit MlaD
MALQDLTPQLRTRLSRMERAVGWFVILATALLFFGFGYYVYETAQRKGWFLKKITYQTGVSTAAGLKVGDPIRLMGYAVGDITEVIPNQPYAYYNVTIRFRIKLDDNKWPGYIWSDSQVKVNASDLLGNRYLEITKGSAGIPTVLQSTNGELRGVLRWQFLKAQLAALEKEGTNGIPRIQALAVLNAQANANPQLFYTNHFHDNVFFLDPAESPAVTERLDKLVSQVEAALPNILNLTNQLIAVLSNTTTLTAHLSDVAANARPAVSNLALATAHLDQPGALGEWLLPTNINYKLDAVLGGANTTLTNANTNLVALAQNLNQTLENLANMTSNLNSQVQGNSNVLSEISRAIVDTDNLVQGLKRHWLFRSAFKEDRANQKKPPTEPKPATEPLRSPKDQPPPK